MKEQEIKAWFEAHPRALKTFDIDGDGSFSHHEIRWAVKTAITWAERASRQPEDQCWTYVFERRAVGPFSWSALCELHREKQFSFVSETRSEYWLPFVLIQRLAVEGVEPDDAGAEPVPSDMSARQPHPSSSSIATPKAVSGSFTEDADPFRATVLKDIWSDSTYVIETTGVMRGYHTGNVYDSKQRMILKIQPQLISDHPLKQLGYQLSEMNYERRRRRRSLYDRVQTDRIHLNTLDGMTLYNLKRVYHAFFFSFGTEVYSLTNVELGQVLHATIRDVSIGFDSWGSIDTGDDRNRLSIRGPVWNLRFSRGGTVVAKMMQKIPVNLSWILNPKNMYVFSILDRRVHPITVISAFIAMKRTFWLIDRHHRI